MERIDELLRRALDEDVGAGDVTTRATVPDAARCEARIEARERLVVAGTAWASRAFELLDDRVRVERVAAEGEELEAGSTVLTLAGPTRAVLTGERLALNLLQRACGIATLTRRYASAVAGSGARVVDTRKTAPGLRQLDKAAVRVGGGVNHRHGLDDGVLLKDNHVAACGSVGEATRRAREEAPHTLRIEVEVRRMGELDEALEAGADVVLLDNMTLDDLREAVRRAREALRPPILEASGGVELGGVRKVADTGVDLVSVGALTHSPRAADLSLTLSEVGTARGDRG